MYPLKKKQCTHLFEIFIIIFLLYSEIKVSAVSLYYTETTNGMAATCDGWWWEKKTGKNENQIKK